MTKKSSTKRALFTSLLSILLCVSMLVSSTFAWFTDKAETKVNTIVSGNLDLVLEYLDENNTWTEVTSETKLFKENALWEPGYTEVVYLKVSNAGSLALNYQLAVNATNEVAGVNVSGDPIKLSEHIKFGKVVSDAEIAKFTTREEAQAAVQQDVTGLLSFGKQADLLPGKATYVALVVYMPTTVGNEANHNGKDIPSIDLGVSVFATQTPYEEDSFDRYYDAAAHDLQEVNGVININDLNDLEVFAANVNENGNTYAGKTVVLNADIDLAGYEWKPIGGLVSYPSVTFAGTFDGQDHTISNMHAVDTTTVNYATAGLFGSITGTVKNVNIDHATVVSTHYAGGVVGYSSSGSSKIENCKVTNSYITSSAELMADGSYDNGDKVGGIIGYMVSGDAVTGCTVEDTVISAYRDLGGIAGYSDGTVTGNTVKDVTLAVDNAHNYKNYATTEEHDAGAIVGDGSGTQENNTATNVAGAKKEVIKDVEQFKKVLTQSGKANEGNTVIDLTADVDLTGQTWTPVVVDGYNGADVITLEGNGYTITGLTAPLFAGGFAGHSGIVINDLTIADSEIVSTNTLGSGAFIETVDSMDVITLTNCHLKNSTVTGSRTGGLIGWNSGYNNVNDGSVKTYVTITDCSVVDCTITGNSTVGGIVGHAGANPWTWNTITNCTVKNCKLTSNDDSYRVGAIVGTANVGEVTITGCTSTGNTIKQNNNGTEIARPEGQSELYGRFVPQNGSGKLTIDGTVIN